MGPFSRQIALRGACLLLILGTVFLTHLTSTRRCCEGVEAYEYQHDHGDVMRRLVKGSRGSRGSGGSGGSRGPRG